VIEIWRSGRLIGRAAAVVGALIAVAALLLALSAVRLLPQLRNPFSTRTTVRSQPPLLKSITSLSRYEAASGSYQVVVDLSKQVAFLPSFIAGSQTLFIGAGTVIAYVDFAGLKGSAITVSPGNAVTIRLPGAQLEPAVLDVNQSYVFAEQQGLVNRITTFFAGNPNSQQAVYIAADNRINAAAKAGPLRADAERNATALLDGMLTSLGYRHVTVTYS
jgi:Protein of unknown function (DUF4230)